MDQTLVHRIDFYTTQQPTYEGIEITQESGLVLSFGANTGQNQTVLFPNQGYFEGYEETTEGYDFYFFGFESENAPEGIVSISVVSYDAEEYQAKL